MQKIVWRLGQIIMGYFWGIAFKIDAKMKVSFNDIIGYESQKSDLAKIIRLLELRSTSKCRLRQRIPKGILIDGPKGTGKTLIAKSIAVEADVPFISMS